MINRLHIDTIHHPLFPAIWELYEGAFPRCERRTKEAQERILTLEGYCLEAWADDQEGFLGLIGWWDGPEFRYIEHYAIHPQYRSLGYGSLFLSGWLQEYAAHLPVILEIEPVTDSVTQKRLSFYQRLGFKENTYDYCQPPYHNDLGPIPMQLLSYPKVIDTRVFQSFAERVKVFVAQGRSRQAGD